MPRSARGCSSRWPATSASVATDATVGIPAAKLGVLLSAPNIRRLAVLVGQGAARDLLLTGRAMNATEVREIGFAQRVADDALASGIDLASEIARLAPLSVQGHKRALNLVADATALDDGAVQQIRALEEAAFASADLQEGLAAFGEKRTPNFAVSVVRRQQPFEVVVEDEQDDRERDPAHEPGRPAVVPVEQEPPAAPTSRARSPNQSVGSLVSPRPESASSSEARLATGSGAAFCAFGLAPWSSTAFTTSRVEAEYFGLQVVRVREAVAVGSRTDTSLGLTTSWLATE